MGNKHLPYVFTHFDFLSVGVFSKVLGFTLLLDACTSRLSGVECWVKKSGLTTAGLRQSLNDQLITGPEFV